MSQAAAVSTLQCSLWEVDIDLGKDKSQEQWRVLDAAVLLSS